MRRVAFFCTVLGFALSTAGCLSIPTDVFDCAVDDDCPSGQVCGRGGVCTTTCADDSSDPACETYPCYNGSVTVRRNQLCDGVTNCPNDQPALSNGLDELSCFDCPVGAGTVHTYTHCDGRNDCNDGFDEAACWICPGGGVTKLSYVCDGGTPDCNDGSDEGMCVAFDCGLPDPMILPNLVCNGEVDCPTTNLDEATCVDFACLDGSDTLPEAYLCDGWGDCDDGSDERPMNCPVVCETGQRFPFTSRCDGIADCPSGLDEDPAVCP